jgi:hypothetical protein
MERIVRRDLIRDRFRAAVDALALGSFFQLSSKRIGDILDLRIVRQR